jgi:hypothetical protein
VLLVVASLTAGIVGGWLVTGGNWLGLLLIACTPAGILVALRLTPEGGTTGYLDRNL